MCDGVHSNVCVMVCVAMCDGVHSKYVMVCVLAIEQFCVAMILQPQCGYKAQGRCNNTVYCTYLVFMHTVVVKSLRHKIVQLPGIPVICHVTIIHNFNTWTT